MSLPTLGHRAISAYNRLAITISALTYVLRFIKPTGAIGPTTVSGLNSALRAANQLFQREADVPRIRLIDPTVTLTMADFAIVVTQLSAACLTFEERYAHLTEPPEAPQPLPYVSSDGLPSPHR